MSKPYKDTLLLPRTEFPMKTRPDVETDLQRLWDRNGLYDRLRTLRAGNRKVIVHDGPPYANGNIHFGHLFNKVLKDIVTRWQIMKGHDSQFIPGWDCHGLPIEHTVMQSIAAAESATHVPSMTASDIRSQCRDVAHHWVNVQRDQFRRLGILGEWDNPYLTTNSFYEQCVLEVLQSLVESDRVERRSKPISWCAHDRTALAEAELEYKDVESDAVYVAFPAHGKFPTTDLDDFSFLAWTTTPWTLPANVALAVSPAIRYCLVEVYLPAGPARYVVAESLLAPLVEATGLPATVLATVDGRQLGSVEYQTPFAGHTQMSRVIFADFVSDQTGTGIVHIAPAHGVDDYNVARDNHLPVISPVNEEGRYHKGVHPELDGLLVTRKDTIETVIRLLDHLILHRHKVTHSYPHCWRCKRPTITRATPQWFVSMSQDDLRGKTLAAIQEVNWVPSVAQNRIEAMVEGRPDWCISRQRYWGVEIPAMECQDCGHTFINGETIRLRIDAGSDWWQANRKINGREFLIGCPACRSVNLLLGRDILDVWFESGSSHYAAIPADDAEVIVIEGSDQHRGWFQSSLLLGTAMSTLPFHTVLTHGFIVDQNGKKLSKSEDAPAVVETVETYGADPIRLLVASADYTDDLKLFDRKGKNYTIKGVKDAVDAYNKIRNTFRFMLGNLRDRVPHYRRETLRLQPVDQYIIHRLCILVGEVTEAYDTYQFYRAHHAIYNFCVVDLSSVYFDVVKDRLYNDVEESNSGRAARWTLTEIFYALARLVNPILPHLAAEVWDYSPHDDVDLFEVPRVPSPKLLAPDFEPGTWSFLLEVRHQVLGALEALRASKMIGSALEAMVVIESNGPTLEAHREILRDLCLVSSLVFKPHPERAGFAVHAVPLTDHPKCERCWKRQELLNDRGLCSRCRSAVRGKSNEGVRA